MTVTSVVLRIVRLLVVKSFWKPHIRQPPQRTPKYMQYPNGMTNRDDLPVQGGG